LAGVSLEWIAQGGRPWNTRGQQSRIPRRPPGVYSAPADLIGKLTLVVFPAPFVAEAQPAGKAASSTLGLDRVPPSLEPLRNTPKALGYEEGKNLWSDCRNLPDENAAHDGAGVCPQSCGPHCRLREPDRSRCQGGHSDDSHRLCPRHRPGQRGVREEPRPARWKHHGAHGQWRRAQTEGDVP